MEKKTCQFKNENGLIYKLSPEQPSNETYNAKWYFHCTADRTAARIYSLPNERGQLNNKKLSLSERVAYAQKIADYYNSICQVSEEELGNSCFVPNQITTEATQTLLDNLEKKKHRLRHRTVKGYESQVNIFQKYLQEHNMSEMTPEIIKSFLEYLSINDYDNSTVNSYRYLFGSLLGEEMKEQTYKNTEKLKVNPDGAMYFTRPQIIELRDAIEKTYPQLWLGCMMVFYCFARPRSEMLRLKVGDINFYDHTMVFHGDIAKNIKTQTIVVPRPMLDLFFEYGINNYPSSYYIIGKGGQPNKEAQPVNRLGNIHRKVLIQLKYDTEKYIMYSWKNTGIIEAVRAGIDLVSLARQVRHHSLDQLNQYLVKVGAIHCPDLSFLSFKTNCYVPIFALKKHGITYSCTTK